MEARTARIVFSINPITSSRTGPNSRRGFLCESHYPARLTM
jgi:hypothetical protein